jgi:hypothetical protein
MPGYYKSSDEISGIYVSKRNIMFEWNEELEDPTASKRMFKKKKLYKTQQSHKLHLNGVYSSSLNRRIEATIDDYRQEIEENILMHNYADRVKVSIDAFEYAYGVYEVIRNYFVNHQGFKVKNDFIPNNYAVFVRNNMETGTGSNVDGVMTYEH